MMTNTVRREVILALSSGSRSVGAAVADPLGLRQVRIKFLNPTVSGGRAWPALHEWAVALVDEFQPARIVIDELSARRTSARNKVLHGYIQGVAGARCTGPVVELRRKDSIAWICRDQRRCEAGDGASLRLAARILAENWPQEFLQRIPTNRYRTEWDRTWGQAVAAMTLALYARDETHEVRRGQIQLPLSCPGP